MHKELIERLRKLAENATHGTWFSGESFYASIQEVYGASFKIKAVCHAYDLTEQQTNKRYADIAYIAAANPTAILSMLDAIEALQAKLNDTEVLLEECKMDWSGDVIQLKAEHKHEADTLRQQLAEAQARTEDVMKELLWIRHRMRKDEANDGVVISNAVGSQWSKWIDRVDAIKKAMKGAA
jgi:Ead/Ea22-like protein